MASKLEPCSIGILLGSTEDCHKTTYARKVGTNNIDESCIEEDEEYKPEVEDGLHNLAAKFSSLGCTPVKTKFAQRDRVVYAKRKAQEAQTAITDEVARRLNADSNELQTCQKCTDLDAIIEGIKEKCSTSNMEATLKLITLAPPS
ncbi:Hypothetical predicted protein [Paramuricea clavata]|uniref:Uncharacterized protein n=1 Tax=Paramuricea clavata TaxID=317549 RepID=A0A7D9HH88_PARCT|nr:Hypothetical predicted protein [Paramuricea clavata]